MASKYERPIAIFDSGVGGLSVLRQIRVLLPNEDIVYFADQAHVPYGPRPADEIRQFSLAITDFLLKKGAKIVTVACNTASAAALSALREQYPEVPFVGMEPAVKPGAGSTRQGKIGILATTGTFGSRRYASLMARYAQGVVAFEDPCPGLVEQIEMGDLEGPRTRQILEQALTPMLSAGVDTLVLGCTHYPFVVPLIRQLAGPEVLIIDPAPAVARQVQRVLNRLARLSDRTNPGQIQMFTTGDPQTLATNIRKLFGRSLSPDIQQVSENLNRRR